MNLFIQNSTLRALILFLTIFMQNGTLCVIRHTMYVRIKVAAHEKFVKWPHIGISPFASIFPRAEGRETHTFKSCLYIQAIWVAFSRFI